MQTAYGYSTTTSYKSTPVTTPHVHRKVTKKTRFIVRLTFFCLVIFAAFSFGAWVHSIVSGSDSNVAYAAVEGSSKANSHKTFIVTQGDTLWTIARDHAPKNADVRDYISDLKKLNDMKTSALKEGMTLLLP